MKKNFNFLFILLTQILLGQSMNGYSYDQVINELRNERLRPMYNVNIRGHEIKSLLLEKDGYRVNYIFDKHDVCEKSIVIINDSNELKTFLSFLKEEFEYIGKNRWISASGRTCVEYYDVGGAANFLMVNCPQTETKPYIPAKKSNDLNMYQVTSDKAYFYSTPNITNRKKAYLVVGEKFNVLKNAKDFVYTEFTNKKGIITKGWIRKSDVSK